MAARSALLFLFILVVLDAAVVAALGRGPSWNPSWNQTGPAAGDDSAGTTASAGERRSAGTPRRSGRRASASERRSVVTTEDTGWALCQTRFEGKPVTPTSVAVTYLDAGLDDQLVPGDVRSWFGPVPGVQVDVYKLELHDGRRRIALELSQGKWPTWHEVAAGQSGEAVCGVIRAALLAAGIGRPALPSHASPYQAPPTSDGRDGRDGDQDDRAAGQVDPESDQSAGIERSRHDFEFIYARRPRLYRTIEWVGTLDHALELDAFVALRQWLNRSGP